MSNINLPNVEQVASKVHDAWWEEKKKQGFHAPRECQNRGKDAQFPNEKFYKFCDKCHPDMYPYEELPDNVQEYDRVTVKTVYKAIEELSA